MKNLVIVESPTKARTISQFLGQDFRIESSYGHLRDLPQKKMGVDIEHDFTPQYVIPRKNQKIVTALKKLALASPIIYFATDEDREGEAIAWHLLEAFKKENHNKKEKVDPVTIEQKVKRIVFHEITEEAIKEAFKNPRGIDLHLVNAQQARRILDRLVGYELSPFLWKKVAKGLSAGRVQSVALRLIVEREKEIQGFKPQEYRTIEAIFQKNSQKLSATLYKIEQKRLDKFAIKTEREAKGLVKKLEKEVYHVAEIRKKEIQKNPYAPFITSTLQQEANRRLGFSARQTMRLAQQLYEGVGLGKEGAEGLITYMRTDSVNLADKFLSEAQNFLQKEFGSPYAIGPKKYKTKSRLAQEAHEAIRPTDVYHIPEKIKQYLDNNQYRLYDLIWKRAVASQMPVAIFDQTSVDINNENDYYTFRSVGTIIKFDGYLKVYPDYITENRLPELQKEEKLNLEKITPSQHFTQPPPRYSDAGLVKALEERDIGRPSTYATIIGTLIDRKYTERENRRLKPTEIGIIVNDLLVEHFPVVMDYKFTAHLEDDLDDIANAKKEWVPVVREFYQPFKENLMKKQDEVDKIEETSKEVCEKCGQPMVIKMSRYGKFLACTGYPDCKNTKPLDKNGEIIEKPPAEATEEKCDKCGSPMVIKRGRYGPFMACSAYPDCRNIKNIEQKIDVKCPQCGQGEMVAKRSRRGKTFYSCNRYPDCKFALWQRPTGEKCPECSSLLVYVGQDKVGCSNKECKHKK